MAASQSTALKHWARIIKRWPVDKVRPEHVSFQKLMQQRISKLGGPSTSIENNIKGNDALVSPDPPMLNEQKEMQQVNALYSLLENRYSGQYPLPQILRHPSSSPTHYDDVVREMSEAPSRSWFSSFTKRIKGSLRFK